MTNKHYDKYEAIVQAMGVESLKLVVLAMLGRYGIDTDTLAHKIKQDKHLNNIPLRIWDGKHYIIMPWAIRLKQGWGAKKRGWALADTVCTLKHVALHHI
jgi:hypothetical protein